MSSGGSSSSAGSNGIVVEVLNRENYSNWSTLVKNYLKGEGLWDQVVDNKIPETEKEKDATWNPENYKALHAIQLSCGNDTLTEIRTVTTAKEAWNKLRASYSENLEARHDSPQTADYDEGYDLHAMVNKGLVYDAKSWINGSPNVVFNRSPDGRTVLHAAVSKGLTETVVELINLGRERLLKMQDKKGYTALALVAELTDNKKMAEYMVLKGGEELLSIETKDKAEIPVLLAAASGHVDMTKYLFSVTPLPVLRQKDVLDNLLSLCIRAEIFVVAAAITQHHGNKVLSLTGSTGPLRALAHMPSAFKSGTQLNWWQQIIYKILIVQTESLPYNVDDKILIEIVLNVEPEERPNTMTNTLAGRFFGRVQQFVQTSILLKFSGIKNIYNLKMKHHLVLKIIKGLRTLSESSVEDAMLQAAKNGIYEFIEIMANANPELLFVDDRNKRGIFSHAILNRQEKVFELINEIGGPKEIITSSVDVFKNNMLHLAAELGPSYYRNRMSNAALQMQRELQWFKEVKTIVHYSCPDARNENDQLPHEIFTKKHEQLLKDAQQWAKETSSSFTLVGTLIITIMFAAVFTVPGGTDDKNGTPILLGKNLFSFFIVADAISLVTSSSSVLMFIGILTSRYAEDDFYRSLPLKLLFGLVTLFLSVVSMMVAFWAALALLLKGFHRIVIAAIWLALLPIMVFVPHLVSLSTQFFISTMRSVIKSPKK